MLCDEVTAGYTGADLKEFLDYIFNKEYEGDDEDDGTNRVSNASSVDADGRPSGLVSPNRGAAGSMRNNNEGKKTFIIVSHQEEVLQNYMSAKRWSRAIVFRDGTTSAVR